MVQASCSKLTVMPQVRELRSCSGTAFRYRVLDQGRWKLWQTVTCVIGLSDPSITARSDPLPLENYEPESDLPKGAQTFANVGQPKQMAVVLALRFSQGQSSAQSLAASPAAGAPAH